MVQCQLVMDGQIDGQTDIHMTTAYTVLAHCRAVKMNSIVKNWTKFSPENILSTAAIADIAMTTVFDQLSHHAGTNDVNQIRLETKLSKPRTKPQHVSDLQITQPPSLLPSALTAPANCLPSLKQFLRKSLGFQKYAILQTGCFS